ncbi:MAG TPA: hypothetical protein VJ777_19750, partial [Mycobacterium sp.]|nr:hypothetical protein [Mycobacterium sp.]
MAHSHGEHGNSDLAIPERLRRLLLIVLVPPLVITALGAALLWPRGSGPDLSSVFGVSGSLVKATVTSFDDPACEDALDLGEVDAAECTTVQAQLTEGSNKGRQVSIDAGGTIESLHIGSKILVNETDDDAYYFADFQRDRPLVLLVV